MAEEQRLPEELSDTELQADVRRALQSEEFDDASLDEQEMTSLALEARSSLASSLSMEISSVESSARLLRQLTFNRQKWLTLVRFGRASFIMAFSLLAILEGYHLVLGLDIPGVRDVDVTGAFGVKGHTASIVTVFLLTIFTGVAVQGLLSFLQRSIQYPTNLAERELSRQRRSLRERRTTEVEALVRRRINAVEREGLDGPVVLHTTNAPALVDIEAADSISGKTANDLEEFLLKHDTSAIGLAGPRGVGKTTIMRRICSPDLGYLGVYIQAPVYYSAADFVKFLHAEVAKAMLRDAGGEGYDPLRSITSRVYVTRLMLSAAGVYLGIGVILSGILQWNIRWLSPEVVAGLGILAVSCLLMVQATSGRVEERRRLVRADDPKELAAQELRELEWQASIQSKSKTGFSLFKSVSIEDEDQVAMAMRDRSHPERVGDFRDFLLAYHELANAKTIVVAVDELDKMADPQKAVELINGLKDLFHIRKTHFVVSVSEDALDSFALRGVPVRDVFDSSFDSVLRVVPFEPAESLALLRRRVVRFPEPVGLLCHSLSGGLPRDLIRAARYCVYLRRTKGSPITLGEVAVGLAQHELADATDALLKQVRENGERGEEVALLGLRRILGSNGHLGPTALLDALDCLGKESQRVLVNERRGATQLVVPRFLAAAYAVATASEYFAKPFSARQWSQAIDDGSGIESAAMIAAARFAVAASHDEAFDNLRMARDKCGLPALAFGNSLTRGLSLRAVVRLMFARRLLFPNGTRAGAGGVPAPL
jgi:Cdc6-like AAA superfamily ATPase